ncbi:hypothetical protein D3C77_253170 [compost metagenome]
MSKSGSTSFNFEVMPFSETSFSLREVGKPHIAMFDCGYEEGLLKADLLAAVFIKLSRKERLDFDGSVVCFIAEALKDPAMVAELREAYGGEQLGLWSETNLKPSDEVH